MQLIHFDLPAGPAILSPVRNLLDESYDQLRRGNVAHALPELLADLGRRRNESPREWAEYTRICQAHPITALLREDPFTDRAFSKPRGYAGDAVMMDFIYGRGEYSSAVAGASPFGVEVFEGLRRIDACEGVRHRRRLLAEYVDQTAERDDARVLAIAAGHLREAELSYAVRNRRLAAFDALDQDTQSLEVIERDYARFGVRAIPGSVRQILANKITLGQYDLVYAAGLFDYLSRPIAVAFTERMLRLTRPGGKVLVPNFLKNVSDSGYMEAIMNWHLIYRDHADLRGIARAMPAGQVESYRIFDDPFGAVTYLELTKCA